MHSKVIIIGGGVAGVIAAKTLSEHGLTDFVILEAGEDLGGRLCSVGEPSGITLEMGAGWLHGTRGNPMYSYATKYKVQGLVTDMDNYTVRNTVGEDVTLNAKQVHENLKKARALTKEICRLKKCTDQEVDLSQRAALSMAGWHPRQDVEKSLEFLFYDFMYAAMPEVLSIKASDDFDSRDMVPEDVRVVGNGGFSGLLKNIASEILSPDDSRVRLKELVTHISQSTSRVEVKTKQHHVYSGEFVILTCSMGVLQHNRIQFNPHLPSIKLEKIYATPMTNYKKVFLGFPQKFWDNTEFILNATKRHGHFQVWENLSFLGQNILLATLIGEEADQADFMTNSELESEAMQVLRQMYGPGVPDPLWCRASQWGTDPLFHGSYSVRPLGFTDRDLAILKSPHGRVYFAGEGYSKHSYGEVLGAYETAVDAATQVLSQLDKPVNVFLSKL